jgi:hypothetical protein
MSNWMQRAIIWTFSSRKHDEAQFSQAAAHRLQASMQSSKFSFITRKVARLRAPAIRMRLFFGAVKSLSAPARRKNVPQWFGEN